MGNPVLENRIRIIAWWLVWLLLGAGQSLLLYYTYDGEKVISITDGFTSMIIFSVLALAAWFPIKFFNRAGKTVPMLIVNLLTISAFLILIWLLLSRIIMSLLFPEPSVYTGFWNATLSYRVGSGVLICSLVILTYYLIISYKSLSDKKLGEARLENLLKETELKMLRSQINPHFLFNSLNSVSSLTITDPEKAREMVIKLSDFMRYALSRKDERPVTIRQELESLRLYLDIEKTRFGSRLATDEDISPDCLNIRIPTMLLQPLFENAVKYGVHESTGTITIRTSLKCNSDYAEINISNNYDPDAILPAGTGTGLLNVRRRLELVYGREASVQTEKGDGFFTVRLRIPVKFPE